MSNLLFPLVLAIFILYLIFKVLSVFQENKKLNLSISSLKDKNKERAALFNVTKEIDDLLIDNNNQLFKFKGQIQLFSFQELSHFEILLDNKLITSTKDSVNVSNSLAESLTDYKEIKNIDLVFYVTGLNEGRYTHQFLYHPIKIESDDYPEFISRVNQTILDMEQMINA